MTATRAPHRVATLLVLGLVAVGCRGDRSNSESKRTTRLPRTRVDLLASLAGMVGTVLEPAALEKWSGRIDRDSGALDAYIDELLKTRSLARDVLPSLLFGVYGASRTYYAVPAGYILKSAPTGAPGGRLYYLREKCSESDAVSVHPWWQLETNVLICPDSYRPERWTVTKEEQPYHSAMMLTCDGQVGSPELELEPLCGCGPNLIRCLRDDGQYNALGASMREEIRETTATILEEDRPIDELFTSNGSYRDRNVEYYYRRQKIGALKIADPVPVLRGLDQWPEEGQWAPREELSPGQHAGVLTAPQILHWAPDRRQRQRIYYDIMWCGLANAFGATTEKVLELNATANLAFVHESWKRLANTELCTDCHARLDYGFQFFLGFPDSRAGIFFTPTTQLAGDGPLYGRSISDGRGTGTLTPQGFARLATAQPEFEQCVTEQVVQYVLGGYALPQDRRTVAEVVHEKRRFRQIMKTALAIYARRWWEAAEGATPTVSSPGSRDPSGARPSSPDDVAIGPALRAKLDEHCVDCHFEGQNPNGNGAPRAFDLQTATMPRRQVARMIDLVAYGIMPKEPATMATADREQLVRLLIHELMADPAARRDSERYFLGGWRGLPAQLPDTALMAVGRAAGTHSQPPSWGFIERSVRPAQASVTPGFVAAVALEALRACKEARRSGPNLKTCLEAATREGTIVRAPAP